MFRRKFFARLAMAGAATIGTAHSADSKTVVYQIKGFTCVTCAVGLDTLLQQQPGVVHSKSSYTDATATIEFRPSVISENALKALISEMGFRAK
jgi:copper chaperone CopZ